MNALLASRGAKGRRGMTIMEILFAVIILSVGFMGLLSIFPTAVISGEKTVEDVYASMIARSVIDAMHVGLREARGQRTVGTGQAIHFVFNHDGVRDLAVNPDGTSLAAFPTISHSSAGFSAWDKDYTILLPWHGGSQEKTQVFVYPRGKASEAIFGIDAAPSDAPTSTNGSGNPANATDESDLATYGKGLLDDEGNPLLLANGTEARQRWIRNAYQLKTRRIVTDADEIVIPDGDPYSQYSFAFSLRLARIDGDAGGNTDGVVDEQDTYKESLIEVIVYVFRGFSGDKFSPRNNPIQAFASLIAR